MKSSFSVLCMVVGGLMAIHSAVLGQAPTLPAWYSNHVEVLNPQVIHPAFAAVATERGLNRLNNQFRRDGSTADWSITAHGLHGDLIFHARDILGGATEPSLIAVFGAADFDYVLDVVEDAAADSRFLVAGLKQGLPVFKIAAFDFGTSPPIVTWQATVLSGLSQVYPVTVYLDDCRIQFFDVATNHVFRYGDSDADGLPDLNGAWGGVDCSALEGTPASLHKHPAFGVELGRFSGRLLRRRWFLEEVSGGQALVFADPNGQVNPSIMAEDLTVGQRAIAIRYLPSGKFRVKVTRSGQIFDASGEKTADARSGISSFLLSQALQAGDIVHVEDAADPSIASVAFTITDPIRPLLMPHATLRVRPGETLVLHGERLNGSNVRYELKLNGTVVAAAITPVSARRVDVEVPALPQETVFAFYEIDVVDDSISPKSSSIRVRITEAQSE